jgi:hypothetical protein
MYIQQKEAKKLQNNSKIHLKSQNFSIMKEQMSVDVLIH